MTFNERRARANVKRIKQDQQNLVDAFLKASTKFVSKREKLILDALEALVSDVFAADTALQKQVIIDSFELPSKKEWAKKIKAMVTLSYETGGITATDELIDAINNVKFNDTPDLPEGSRYMRAKIKNKHAQDFIDAYSYQIAEVTDNTTQTALRRVFRSALNQGKTIEQTMEDLQNTVENHLGKSRLENIARTETIKFYNAGRVERYLDPDLGDFVVGLQYDSILDSRTTDICTNLDGKTIKVSDTKAIERFTPPNHFQCRSTWLPVTKFETDVEFDFPSDYKPADDFNWFPAVQRGDRAIEQIAKVLNADLTTMTTEERAMLSDAEWAKALEKLDDKEKLEYIIERADNQLIKNGVIVGDTNKVGVELAYNMQQYGFEAYYDGQSYTLITDFDPRMNMVKFKMQDQLYGFSKHGQKLTSFDDLLLSIGMNANDFNGVAFNNLRSTWNSIAASANNQTVFNKQMLVLPESKRKKGGYKYRITKDNSKISADDLFLLDATTEEVNEWLNKYVSPKALKNDRLIQVNIEASHRIRAYAIPANHYVNVGLNSQANVHIHEIAHIIHFEDQRTQVLVQEFFNKRTKGEMLDAINGYGEVGKRDTFFNPYVGRIYEFEENDPLGMEVVSMGIERMYSNPEAFYREDKEHFLLTYAIMQGLGL